MKKTFRTILAGALALLTVSCYDDSALRNDLEDVENALSGLKAEFEAFKTKLNGEVSALQTSYNTLNASFTEYKGLNDQQVLTLNTTLDALKAQVGVDDNSGIRKSVTDVLAALNAYKTEADGKITTAQAALEALEGADSSLKTQLANLSAQLGTKADAQTLAALVETVESITVRSIAEDDKGNIVITLANNQTLTVAKDGNGVVKVVDGEWVVSGPEGDVALGLPITQENLVFGLDYNTNELRYSVDGLSEWNANKEWIGTGIFVSGNTMGAGIISDVWVQEDKGIASVMIDGEFYDFMLMADGASSTLDILSGKAMFAAGQTKTFDIKAVGLADVYVMSKPEGWRASINGVKLSVTAPAEGNAYAEQEGLVLLHGTSEDGLCKVAKLLVTTSAQGLEVEVDVATANAIIRNSTLIEAMGGGIGGIESFADGTVSYQFNEFYWGIIDLDSWETAGAETIIKEWNLFYPGYNSMMFPMGTYGPDHLVDEFNFNIVEYYQMMDNYYEEGMGLVLYAFSADSATGDIFMDSLVYAYYNPVVVKIEQNWASHNEISLSVTTSGADSYIIGYDKAEIVDGKPVCDMQSSFENWRFSPRGSLGLEVADASGRSVMLSGFGSDSDEVSPLLPGTTYFVYAIPMTAGKAKTEYDYETDFEPYVSFFSTNPLVEGGASTVTISQDTVATNYTKVVAKLETSSDAETVYYKFYKCGSEDEWLSMFETDADLVADIVATGNMTIAGGVDVRNDNMQAGQTVYLAAIAVDMDGAYGKLVDIALSTKNYPYDKNIAVSIVEDSIVFDDNGKPTVTYAVSGAESVAVYNSWKAIALSGDNTTTPKRVLTDLITNGVDYYTVLTYPVVDGKVTITYNCQYDSYVRYAVLVGFNADSSKKITGVSPEPYCVDLYQYMPTN